MTSPDPGMTSPYPDAATPAADGIGHDQLVALRAERWQEVHHLDDLDRRSILLVVTGATATVLTQPATVASLSRAQVLVAVLSSILCIGSIYSTVRNRVTMIYAIWTIDYIDEMFNRSQYGLFAYAGNRGAPRTLGSFCKGLMFSIRGAIVLFFTVVMGYSAWIIALAAVRWWPDRPGAHAVAILTAFVVTVILVPWCFYDNWRRARPAFESINGYLPRNALLGLAQTAETTDSGTGETTMRMDAS